MPILRLCGESLRFLLVNSWPVVAAAALIIPLEFGLDLAFQQFAALADPESPLAVAFALFQLLLQSLIYTFYVGFVYYLIWTRLFGLKLRMAEFRDWFRPCFFTLFIYMLIITFTSLTGLIILVMPLLIFLPYLEMVILFEKKRLRPALRRNLGLFFTRPWPPALLGLLLIMLVGWVPFGLQQVQVPREYFELYRYSNNLITLPLNVAFMVLYFMISAKRTPPGFTDLAEEPTLEP